MQLAFYLHLTKNTVTSSLLRCNFTLGGVFSSHCSALKHVECTTKQLKEKASDVADKRKVSLQTGR